MPTTALLRQPGIRKSSPSFSEHMGPFNVVICVVRCFRMLGGCNTNTCSNMNLRNRLSRYRTPTRTYI